MRNVKIILLMFILLAVISGCSSSEDTPIANAGPDQVVAPGATVTLDGSGSTTVTAYFWSTSNDNPATVTLSSTSVANPTFVAPSTLGDYGFILSAICGHKSSSDEVTIKVLPQALIDLGDLAPEAVAFDGTHFWTAIEPSFGVAGSGNYPGEDGYQAYILRHHNDTNKSVAYVFTPPYNFNIDGLTSDGTYLWAATGTPETTDQYIYQYELDENSELSLAETYDVDHPTNGLAWDGVYLWANTDPDDYGIVRYDLTGGITENARYQDTGVPTDFNAKGLAFDGTYIWSAYKYENPPGTGVYGERVVFKHEDDATLSVLESFVYSSSPDDLLNYHPGGLVWSDGVLYSASADPGNVDGPRGGRIVQHDVTDILTTAQIYFFNEIQ